MIDFILEKLRHTNITIEEMEKVNNYLNEIEEDSKILQALYNAGVDNWTWYGEAVKKYYEENEEE